MLGERDVEAGHADHAYHAAVLPSPHPTCEQDACRRTLIASAVQLFQPPIGSITAMTSNTAITSATSSRR